MSRSGPAHVTALVVSPLDSLLLLLRSLYQNMIPGPFETNICKDKYSYLISFKLRQEDF